MPSSLWNMNHTVRYESGYESVLRIKENDKQSEFEV